MARIGGKRLDDVDGGRQERGDFDSGDEMTERGLINYVLDTAAWLQSALTPTNPSKALKVLQTVERRIAKIKAVLQQGVEK